MDLFEYRKKHGQKAIEKLADDVGTSVKYLGHLIFYRKRPGVDLAHRLVTLSGGQLTILSLMLSTEKLEGKRREIRVQRASKALAEAREAADKASASATVALARAHASVAKRASQRAVRAASKV